MSKLLYIANVNISNQYLGVLKKIVDQTKSLIKAGIDAYALIMGRLESDVALNVIRESERIHLKALHGGIVHRRRQMAAQLATLIHDLQPNVIWLRYFRMDWCIHYVLRSSKIPIIVDFPSYVPLEEKQCYKTNLWNLIDRRLGHLLVSSAYGVISPSKQVLDCNLEYYRATAWRRFIIRNGVDVNSVPLCKCPRLEDTLHMLFVGNVRTVHALDRVVYGIATSSRRRYVYLHVAGAGDAVLCLRKLSKDLGVEDQVLFHGPLIGKELDNLFDQCHVALGCLGWHRIGLSGGTELKQYEYMARGIPYITAKKSDGLSTDSDYYCIEVPSNDEPIVIDSIVDFINKFQEMSDIRERERLDARRVADWSVLLQDLVSEIIGLKG